MKNAIYFFYNIYINEISKINDEYFFSYNSDNYKISEFKRDLEEAIPIYNLNVEMLNNGIKMYEIILNKDNNILFNFEGINYCLLKFPNIENRIITYQDILNFRYIPVWANNKNKTIMKKLDKSDWTYYWERKIDYFEYQFYQVQNKYKVIKDSINYYIGIWENAISYYNDNILNKNIRIIKEVCHKRVSVDMDLLEYYNPLNLVIDTKVRDISEYLKSFVLNENFTMDKLNKMLSLLSLEIGDIYLLISRSLFPSFYFDLYESIVNNETDDEKIKIIVKKHDSYRILLKSIYMRYTSYNIVFPPWILR